MKNSVTKLLIPMFFMLTTSAFLDPVHSKLTINIEAIGDCKARLVFKVSPDADMKLTPDAPWSVTIAKDSGFIFEDNQNEYKNKHLDRKLPGFNVMAEPQNRTKPSGEMQYELRSFVCSKDGSKCFPELHKGTYKWKLDTKNCRRS